MSNIKDKYKQTQEFDEDEYIQNQNHDTVAHVEELKAKLSNFLIPQNQRKGKRKACEKRN